MQKSIMGYNGGQHSEVVCREGAIYFHIAEAFWFNKQGQ